MGLLAVSHHMFSDGLTWKAALASLSNKVQQVDETLLMCVGAKQD